MNEQVKVVIVDGHTLVRYGLAGLVDAEPDIEVVGSTGLGAEAASMVVDARPDVLVLDVVLPDIDGLEVASELRSRYADLGIVLLASDGQDDVLFEALESGVSAFVDQDSADGRGPRGHPARSASRRPPSQQPAWPPRWPAANEPRSSHS